ncbi:hypothetical protein GCK72_010072 [Caenorhabditis remanei]|uniref:Divalent-cation tolerance protein CutA n=1 Tax=Caenorhabditis remanei TaxID=31234 RepID=A0A6A5H477_CAERE|nr:hypothetical protein GCK72_010072 [Caenorhabditis remanei]KAF1761815.1 hypothetical protein GCK72_010072 [Caenorhabditis remanei]
MTTPAVKLILVYVTAPSRDVAMNMARITVAESLVACANVIPGVTSVYQWQGKIEEDQEHVVVMKTVDSKAEELSQRVRSLHPAVNPCFVTLPIEKATADFAEWIIKSTQSHSI